MSAYNPFTQKGNAVSIAATTTTANVAITMTQQTPQLLVSNTSAVWIAFNWGTSSGVTATVNNQLIAPGGQAVVSVPVTDTSLTTYIAAITLSGTGTVYFGAGIGE